MNLKNLPNVVLNQIFDFINFEEMSDILLVNKFFWLEFYDSYLNHKKLFLKNKLPPNIFELIKDYNFGLIKYLDYKKSFIKLDYVDNVSVDDMSAPIMYSIDEFDRPFLSFLIDVKNKNDNQKSSIVHSLFQRYSDNKYFWVFGEKYSTYNLHNQAAFNDKSFLNYKSIIDKGTLEIDNYDISLA